MGHCLEQSPQWLGSESRLTHVVPHMVGSGVVQEVTQPLPEHIGLSTGHVTVQARQFEGVLIAVSHPLSPSPIQWA